MRAVVWLTAIWLTVVKVNSLGKEPGIESVRKSLATLIFPVILYYGSGVDHCSTWLHLVQI